MTMKPGSEQLEGYPFFGKWQKTVAWHGGLSHLETLDGARLRVIPSFLDGPGLSCFS